MQRVFKYVGFMFSEVLLGKRTKLACTGSLCPPIFEQRVCTVTVIGTNDFLRTSQYAFEFMRRTLPPIKFLYCCTINVPYALYADSDMG